MMSVEFLREQIVHGLISGAMYALMASGLSLIWGTMRVLNFAHGEFFMLGGFFALAAMQTLGLGPLWSGAIAVVAVFLIGMLIHRSTVHGLLKRPGWEFGTIAATLGLSIVLQDVALLVWGERFQAMPYYVEGVIQFFGVRMPLQRVLIIAVAVAVLVLLALVLRFTRFGSALRAVASDAEAALACGIEADRIHTLTFGLAVALAALAGVILAPIVSVSPWMGVPLLLKGFIVVVLGGLGSFSGAVLGGLILGVIESLGVGFFSSQWREVIAFGVLIGVLWLRPQGLFGVRMRES